MDDLMDYSLYDVNGDAYTIRIKKRDAIKYDQDHLMAYRMLNKLKRSGQRCTRPDNGDISGDFAPVHNSTMLLMVEKCPSPDPVNDLRSPLHKKGRLVEEEQLNRSFELLEFDDQEVIAVPLPDDSTDRLEDNNNNLPVTEFVTEWTDNAVHLFINEMGARISKFNLKRTPRGVYDEISQSMHEKGFKFTNDELYKKKRGLESTFCREKLKGLPRTWPFFEGMQQLHSGVWPVGFKCGPVNEVNAGHSTTQPLDTPDIEEGHNPTVFYETEETAPVVETPQKAGGEPVRKKSYEWDNHSDAALIEEVAEATQKFSGKNLVKNLALFNEVAVQMANRGMQISKEECQKRYTALKVIYNGFVDAETGTGAAPCAWPLFEAMSEIEGDKVTVKAPITVSLGAVAKVTRAQETAEKIRKGKGRPPNTKRVERLMGNGIGSCSSGSIGPKNRALDLQQQRLQFDMQMQQQRLEHEMNFLSEFKAFRTDQKERASIFQEGVQVLKDLKASRDALKERVSLHPIPE